MELAMRGVGCQWAAPRRAWTPSARTKAVSDRGGNAAGDASAGLPELPDKAAASEGGADRAADEPDHEAILGEIDELAARDDMGSQSGDHDTKRLFDSPLYDAGVVRDELVEGLHAAAMSGSPHAYVDAIAISEQRRALAAEAEELRRRFERDLKRSARRAAPKMYGWTSAASACMPELPLPPWLDRVHAEMRRKGSTGPPMLTSSLPIAGALDALDQEDVWHMFCDLHAHEINLEDPHMADGFFNDLRRLMTADDLDGVDPSVLRESYPWLGVEGRKEAHRRLFSHPVGSHDGQSRVYEVLLKKHKRKPGAQSSDAPFQVAMRKSTPTTARKRLDEELAAKEAKLRQELNSKFRATPAPISSLVPKFKYMMQDSLNPLLREALDHAKKQISSDGRPRTPRVTETAILDGKKRRERLIENERAVGLTPEHTFQPRITGHVPDFDALQGQFSRQLELHKQMRGPTKPAPFSGLETHEDARRRRIREQQERYERELKQQAAATKPKPTTLNKKTFNHAETKATHSWKLKVEHLQTQKEAQKLIDEMEEQSRLEQEERKRVFAFKIRARIDKSQARQNAANAEAKRRQHVEDQKRRTEEYRQHIQDMTKRISSRMCLFEQEQVNMARRKAKAELERIMAEAALE
ncbi:hypothetical protein HK105_203925 [Polyrhizophydium stewartii]|uniref:Uncharacterized protein n=1 Tax=Polyrhizophydium stewartii TaxID=2732419 RepID=A0ABR4NAD9_9FUNG